MLLAKEGILKWNTVCTVLADNTSCKADSIVDSRTDPTDSEAVSDRFCQREATGHVGRSQTSKTEDSGIGHTSSQNLWII